ncbi:hypothetical protein [Cohnella thailandensis]|jgi:hypothetical protein|uniref:Uncharacterized protein n=1 Tax=Cohnella thailandensis TaxID=557557 RepID=A0A841SR03_9BACL|nr:hypothetical protein [Cohnella thailandensis]MBB6633632.1 hypothetical protein [Cohnella thailandensis]
MTSTVKIPQGDDTMKVELTIKEVMALAGIKFHSNHNVEVSAKRKLQDALDAQYHIDEPRTVN